MGVTGRTDGFTPGALNGGAGRADRRGFNLLLSDTRTAFLLVDEARYRAVERLFGVPRDQSWLVTLVGLGLLGNAVHGKYTQIVSGPGRPGRGDAALGAATLNELLHSAAGEPSREVPYFTGLVALAVAGHLSRPAVARSVHAISASANEMRQAFNHRYGHRVRRRS